MNCSVTWEICVMKVLEASEFSAEALLGAHSLVGYQ